MNASKYCIPCGDCVCNHCANSVECFDNCTGEADFSCFTCDYCKQYDRLGTDNWKSECVKYKITESYAQRKMEDLRLINYKCLKLDAPGGSILSCPRI